MTGSRDPEARHARRRRARHESVETEKAFLLLTLVGLISISMACIGQCGFRGEKAVAGAMVAAFVFPTVAVILLEKPLSRLFRRRRD